MAYKVLLADDSITIQKVVELILSEEDAEVKTVSDGHEALDSLERVRPDVVLADVEMPNMGGYEICKKIKENPYTSDIPVILLAGAFEAFDENRAKDVGAQDFIIKPFDSQDLLEKISKARGLSEEKEAAGSVSTTPGALETETAGVAATSTGGIETPKDTDFADDSAEIVSTGGEFDDDEDFWEAEEVQISDILDDEPAEAPAGEGFSSGAGYAEPEDESGGGTDSLGNIQEGLAPEPVDEALESTPHTTMGAETKLDENPVVEDVSKYLSEHLAEEDDEAQSEVAAEPVSPMAAAPADETAGEPATAFSHATPEITAQARMPEISRDDVAGALREAVFSSIKIPGIESDEILIDTLREKISEVIPTREEILDMSKIAVSAAVPARAELEEQIRAGIGDVIRESVPARPDIEKMVSDALSMDEIRQEAREAAFEAIEKNLTPIFKTLVEEVLWEIIPGVAERTVEHVLKETMGKDLKETISSVAQKTIPEIAENLIAKEIERFRSTE